MTVRDHAQSKRHVSEAGGRNLSDCDDGFLKDASHVIIDRDSSFVAVREYLKQNTATKAVLLAPKSPNLNSYVELWFRGLRSEAQD